MKFHCTGTWNGQSFERVIEAEDEMDCIAHWHFWASIGNARLIGLRVIALNQQDQ